MAYLWFSSLGIQVVSNLGGGGATTQLTDRLLNDFINPGGTFETTNLPPGCETVHKSAAAAGAAQNYSRGFSSQTAVAGCWFKFATTVTPAAVCRVLNCATTGHIIRLNTSGQLQVGAGGTTYVDIFAPTLGTWYWLSASFDCSTGTHAVDVKVYDTAGVLVAQGSDTFVAAATTQAVMAWGPSAAGGGADVYTACPVLRDDLASHPLRRHGAVFMIPTGKGTHVPGAGAFQNAAAGAITDANDAAGQSWTFLDEVPPSGTDFVRQTVDDANGYLEYTFAPMRTDLALGAPVLVQLLGALYPSTTGANLTQQHLNDGGTITAEATRDASVAANTVEYRVHGYQTRPNGGTEWTKQAVDALRARVGYMTLQPAQAGWAGLYLEALAPLGVGFPFERRDAPRTNMLLRR